MGVWRWWGGGGGGGREIIYLPLQEVSEAPQHFRAPETPATLRDIVACSGCQLSIPRRVRSTGARM